MIICRWHFCLHANSVTNDNKMERLIANQNGKLKTNLFSNKPLLQQGANLFFLTKKKHKTILVMKEN